MALFQNTVVKKYTNTLNKLILDERWRLFTTIFHNSVKQLNIRNSKEEQYQAIFLNDLFVQVLGYTQHPNTNYNLITEQKNQTNSKKADGAIILNENVHAVIELKGTETTDLTKIETQAFGYKNNQKECSYVIISNFEKLRFYIDNATEFIEFNLFTLSRDEFNLLFICLSLESMQTDLPKKIKYESVSSEDKITKELYKDYSAFRKELFTDIVKLNPQYNNLELFKKTQKLLDRFLFIFFAEDRQLQPTNLIFSINLEWQKLREARIAVSLYDRYKMYFQDLNTGARVTLPAFGKHTNEIVTTQYDIYAYNGGLFQPDNLLDNININDDLLFKHTKKLSEYDFESEIDVNILGHIFENSLNEIDEMNAQIENTISIGIKSLETTQNSLGLNPNESAQNSMGLNPMETAQNSMGLNPLESANGLMVLNPLESANGLMILSPLKTKSTKTKRKKDGVFYTPKYITKYIVDNTVGKLCEEKKVAIALDETKYSTDKKINVTTKKKLKETLDDYRNWLLQLTIVDPACGSGAFLNQALEFLIAEHKYVDELQAKLFGDALVLSDVEGSILENNLFGVDLNEESVEIAKLSLWLRTAQRNRKLNSLNNNIKCGNSLIDDVTIAGDKAFNWHNNFPNIFKEKNKKAFHLVFTTHNSRVSQRMIEHNVKKGPALELDLEHEIELTTIFKQIIFENKYDCLAYNICKDHVHIIIVCEEEELNNIAKVLKGKSSYLYQFNGFKPIGEPLWSQKFFFAQLDELIWSDVSPKPGYIATDSYLENAISYIKTNRFKHSLQESAQLKAIIKKFVVSLDVAFETEYKGGFDVVIGNPPYVRRTELDNDVKKFIETNYYSAFKQYDLYILFNELSLKITKLNGYIGLIQPNKFLSSEYGFKILNFIVNNAKVVSIYDVSLDKVFSEASVYPYIFIYCKKSFDRNFSDKTIDLFNHCEPQNIIGFKNKTLSNNLINNLKSKSLTLKEITKYIKRGVPNSKIEFTESGNCLGIKSTLLEYKFYQPKVGVKFNYNEENELINKNKEFSEEIILLPRTVLKIRAILKNLDDHILDRIYYFKIENIKYSKEFVLIILNSKIINFYYNEVYGSTKIGGGYIDLKGSQIENFLIPIISIPNQQPFIEKADLMLSLSKEFQLLAQKFSTYFSGQFKIEKPSGKLEKWYNLSFDEFIKEINKAIKTQKGTQLTKKDEFDWIDLFEENKAKVNKLQSEIAVTDKTIDAMVYELYGLSEGEIKIVENS